MKISEINTMNNSSYLVVLFCAAAGKNGEELGNDEEQVVLFVYLLYDVPNNKVSLFNFFSSARGCAFKCMFHFRLSYYHLNICVYKVNRICSALLL